MSSRKDGPGRLEALKGIAIFSGLPEEDLRALDGFMRDRSFPPGLAMFREGEAGDELFVVKRGLVAVTLRGEDAEDIEVSRVGAGAFFGEMAPPRAHAALGHLHGPGGDGLPRPQGRRLRGPPRRGAPGLPRGSSRGCSAWPRAASFRRAPSSPRMVQWGDEARKRAITDPATGLFNRRYLDESFEATVARAGHEGRSLSLRHVRPRPLRQAQRGLRGGILRRPDSPRGGGPCGRPSTARISLVRYGGDEFCFLLPGEPAGAEARCEALCEALRTMDFPRGPRTADKLFPRPGPFPLGGRRARRAQGQGRQGPST